MNVENVIWVDEVDQELGRVPRNLVHKKGELLLHREVMQVLYTDASHKTFFLQKRAGNKKQYPDKWTLSVTAHVNPEDIDDNDHEGYLNAGKREGLEEAGVRVLNQKLIRKEIIETDINQAMAGIVEGEYEGLPAANPEEVAEIRFFTKETINEIRDELTPGAYLCLVLLGILQREENS